MTPTKAASTLLTTDAIIVHEYAFSVQPLLSLHRGMCCSGGLALIMALCPPVRASAFDATDSDVSSSVEDDVMQALLDGIVVAVEHALVPKAADGILVSPGTDASTVTHVVYAVQDRPFIVDRDAVRNIGERVVARVADAVCRRAATLGRGQRCDDVAAVRTMVTQLATSARCVLHKQSVHSQPASTASTASTEPRPLMFVGRLLPPDHPVDQASIHVLMAMADAFAAANNPVNDRRLVSILTDLGGMVTTAAGGMDRQRTQQRVNCIALNDGVGFVLRQLAVCGRSVDLTAAVMHVVFLFGGSPSKQCAPLLAPVARLVLQYAQHADVVKPGIAYLASAIKLHGQQHLDSQSATVERLLVAATPYTDDLNTAAVMLWLLEFAVHSTDRTESMLVTAVEHTCTVMAAHPHDVPTLTRAAAILNYCYVINGRHSTVLTTHIPLIVSLVIPHWLVDDELARLGMQAFIRLLANTADADVRSLIPYVPRLVDLLEVKWTSSITLNMVVHGCMTVLQQVTLAPESRPVYLPLLPRIVTVAINHMGNDALQFDMFAVVLMLPCNGKLQGLPDDVNAMDFIRLCDAVATKVRDPTLAQLIHVSDALFAIADARRELPAVMRVLSAVQRAMTRRAGTASADECARLLLGYFAATEAHFAACERDTAAAHAAYTVPPQLLPGLSIATTVLQAATRDMLLQNLIAAVMTVRHHLPPRTRIVAAAAAAAAVDETIVVSSAVMKAVRALPRVLDLDIDLPVPAVTAAITSIAIVARSLTYTSEPWSPAYIITAARTMVRFRTTPAVVDEALAALVTLYQHTVARPGTHGRITKMRALLPAVLDIVVALPVSDGVILLTRTTRLATIVVLMGQLSSGADLPIAAVALHYRNHPPSALMFLPELIESLIACYAACIPQPDVDGSTATHMLGTVVWVLQGMDGLTIQSPLVRGSVSVVAGLLTKLGTTCPMPECVQATLTVIHAFTTTSAPCTVADDDAPIVETLLQLLSGLIDLSPDSVVALKEPRVSKLLTAIASIVHRLSAAGKRSYARVTEKLGE